MSVGRPSHPDMPKAIQMVRKGMSFTQAAKECGLSVPSVWRACRYLGLERKRGRPPGSIRPHKVWKKVDWKQTDQAIADKVGLSRERVRQVRHQLKKG